MTVHRTLDEQARERCAMAALNLLPPDEAAAFARHVSECALCREEAAKLEAAAGELSSLLLPDAAPPERIWRQIAARVREPAVQTWKRWTSDAAGPELVFRSASEQDWEPTGTPGIEARRLFVDTAADHVTMLVRMAAGSSYPGHVHAGAEECYVLEGDLLVGELHMRAGDYQRAEAGSRHGVQSTERGCTLLLVSSLHDRLAD